MNAELFDALDLLEKERGISKQYMLEKVEQALISAFKKEEEGRENVKIVINEERKEIRVYKLKTVVEEVEEPELELTLLEAKRLSRKLNLGDVAEIPLDPMKFRRMSAMNAKQVIVQGIREAEKGNIIKSYNEKKESIVSAVVLQIVPETGDALVDTGTSKELLKKDNQIAGETYAVGQHIRVFITEVNSGAAEERKEPPVTLSRTHPNFVKRLFEMEIPEIKDGIVLIKAISREAGSRTKIAVVSRDEKVDAIGSCIGNHGMRIGRITDEVHGEKIDVIQYSDDPEEYISKALAPSSVNSVTIGADGIANVLVNADQLSLAIGKEGQNVRLAAKLTGRKIDIKVGDKPKAEEAEVLPQETETEAAETDTSEVQ